MDEHQRDDSNDSLIGPPLPPGFVVEKEDEKKALSNKSPEPSTSKEADEEDSNDSFVGPPLPPNFTVTTEQDKVQTVVENADSDEETTTDDDEDTSAIDRYSTIPSSSQITLQHGSKTVSALAVDPNGVRVATGGYDFEIRLWDLNKMDINLEHFRAIMPCESYAIKHLDFSSDADFVLIISASMQAKIIDKDGFVKGTCVKGDQYISDKANTKGHTSSLNDGCWNPLIPEQFITCSDDGTARIWNLTDVSRSQKYVIKPRSQAGLRASPNSCTASREGLLVTGCSDGSIQGWDLKRTSFVNNAMVIRNAHQRSTEVMSVSFSPVDSNYIASRGADETVKLWDRRNSKSCVNSAGDLFTRFSMTNCSFSPDGKKIMTGTSLEKGRDEASLVFYDTNTFSKEELSFRGSVIRSFWHTKLNQIFVTLSTGEVNVLYDEKSSVGGALNCTTRHKIKKKDVFTVSKTQIITPHALPMFKEDKRRSKKVQLMKDRQDPIKSHRPELPVSGPGTGGRLTSESSHASFIARNIATKNKLDDSLDPREALLRHAKEAAENPYWVSPAYASTQPKAIFRKLDEDEDEDSPPKKKSVLG